MKRAIIVFVVVFVLVGLYLHGTFDRPLYSVGLNFNECARNGFGASFCGKELDEYRERVRSLKTSLQPAKTSTGNTTQEETPQSEPPSGKVTVRALPDSEQVQASITVTRRCASEATSCVWTSAATQYPPLQKCPDSLDTSHIFWNGPLRTHAGTVHQTIAFTPVRESRFLICLYVHDPNTGDELAYGLHVG